MLIISHDVRKAIARTLTIVHKKQRDELKKAYAKKKHVPLDLRSKKTRAMRREMTKYEKNLKTARQQKRQRAFPKRLYTLQ